MATILGFDRDVIDHIVKFADANNLPPVGLIGMGLQESNLDVNAKGDVAIGGSYGVFQIFVVAHGGPPEKWMGLDGLDRSMAEMESRWQNFFLSHGGWKAVVTDLVGFEQEWAPDAQGSISWTEAMARLRISQAVALYSLYLKGQTD